MNAISMRDNLLKSHRGNMASKINVTPPPRCLLANFEATVDFSRREFTCP